MYRVGWITAIRALEVTYGSNGWHPHLHILALMERAQHADDVAEINMWLSSMWQKHLATIGAFADIQHGVDVKATFADVAEYVAKFGREPKQGWTIERELTKAPVKNARQGGFTPFALLDASMNGNEWAGQRFIEYAAAMHNKAQLYIPRSARELLKLDDATDEKLADTTIIDPIETVLARLTPAMWVAIVKANARQTVLSIACTGDVQGLYKVLFDIVG